MFAPPAALHRGVRTFCFVTMFAFFLAFGTIWISAYLNGGEVTISVNKYHEALPELVLLVMFFIASLLYFVTEIQVMHYG